MIPSCVSRSCRPRFFRNLVATDFTNILVRKNVTTSHSRLPENEYIFSFQWWRKKLTNVQLLYDEITGLKEVHDAQSRVIDAENSFVLAQEKRRSIQVELTSLQRKLKEIYAELDKTSRGEDRYVQLVTMEHSVIKEEKRTLEVFQEKEKEEREYFNALSSAVKMGHEKERAQAERTKYWSIIGSVIGTLLGMLASTIINDRRMRELRSLVSKTVNVKVNSGEDYSSLLSDNKCQLELLVSSVQQLNESVIGSIKLSKPIPVEKPDSAVPVGVIASLVLSAVVILLFKQ